MRVTFSCEVEELLRDDPRFRRFAENFTNKVISEKPTEDYADTITVRGRRYSGTFMLMWRKEDERTVRLF